MNLKLKIPCRNCLVFPICKTMVIQRGRNGMVTICNKCSILSDYVLSEGVIVNESEVFYTRIVQAMDEVIEYMISEDE